MSIKKFIFEPLTNLPVGKSPIIMRPLIEKQKTEDNPPVFSLEEVEKFKEESFEAGYRKSQDEINISQQQLENRIEELLQTIGKKLDDFADQHKEINRNLVADAISVAIAIAKKFVGNMINEHSEDIILQSIEKSLEILTKEPKIVINLHNNMINILSDRINEIIQKKKFSGQIEIISNDKLDEVDCIIEWHDGIIKNNMNDVWDSIDDIFTKDLNTR